MDGIDSTSGTRGTIRRALVGLALGAAVSAGVAGAGAGAAWADDAPARGAPAGTASTAVTNTAATNTAATNTAVTNTAPPTTAPPDATPLTFRAGPVPMTVTVYDPYGGAVAAEVAPEQAYTVPTYDHLNYDVEAHAGSSTFRHVLSGDQARTCTPPGGGGAPDQWTCSVVL